MTQTPTIPCPWLDAEDDNRALALGLVAALRDLTLRDGRRITSERILEVFPDLDSVPLEAPAIAVGRIAGRLTGQGLAAAILQDDTGWVLVQDDDNVGEVDIICWAQTPEDRSMLMQAVGSRLSSHGRGVRRIPFDVALPDYYPGSDAKARLLYRGSRQEDSEIEAMRRHRVGFQTFQFRMPSYRTEFVGQACVAPTVGVTR